MRKNKYKYVFIINKLNDIKVSIKFFKLLYFSVWVFRDKNFVPKSKEPRTIKINNEEEEQTLTKKFMRYWGQLYQ